MENNENNNLTYEEAYKILQEQYEEKRRNQEGKFIIDYQPRQYTREIGVYSDGGNMGDYNGKLENMESKIRDRLLNQAKQGALPHDKTDRILAKYFRHKANKKR